MSKKPVDLKIMLFLMESFYFRYWREHVFWSITSYFVYLFISFRILSEGKRKTIKKELSYGNGEQVEDILFFSME